MACLYHKRSANTYDKLSGNSLWMPDLSAIEPVNRISTEDGSWTADRWGFVYVSIDKLISAPAATIITTVSVDNVPVTTLTASGNRGPNPITIADIIPVAPGQVVSFSTIYNESATGGNYTCKFIPPLS
jgi:hypothetical protein